MALFAGAAINAFRTTCNTPLAFAPLSNHSTRICKSRAHASFPVLNTLVTPKLDVSKKIPPQFIRFTSSFFNDASLAKIGSEISKVESSCGKGGACTSSANVAMSAETLRWVFAAAAALLMVLKNVAINKAFLVPLLALQAPRDVITWLRGEYGLWAAFLALLVRLFYYIPGELELPLLFVLLVIASPFQALDFRGTPAATILCAGLAAYVAYQHFSKAGNIKGAFQDGAFMASIAVLCLVCIPFVFFFQGF